MRTTLYEFSWRLSMTDIRRKQSQFRRGTNPAHVWSSSAAAVEYKTTCPMRVHAGSLLEGSNLFARSVV